MKRFTAAKLGLLLAWALAFAAPQANALIISTSLSGNSLDVIASDMDNLISGFDILVTFSDPTLVASAYALDPDDSLLTSQANFFDFSDITGPGSANLVFLSLETDADLFAKQCPGGVCGPIRLATLTFDPALDLTNVVFGFDWSFPHAVSCEQLPGTEAAPLARQCYPVSTAVPEPGTLALLGIGILGLGLSRRRRES